MRADIHRFFGITKLFGVLMRNPVTATAKIVGLCFLIVTALCITYVWAEFAYRFYLYIDYGCKPYLNHVDESYFSFMPATARFGTCCGVMAFASAAWFRYRAFACICALMVIAGLIAPRILDYYHRSLILVTYLEYSSQYGH